jgi:aspartyl-tRNA(Asn)/glutamyl-tRNA(Gln) amidotransferase subunit A
VPRKPGGWSTMTHRGPMTRTVSDAALMLDVIAGYEPEDPYSVRGDGRSFLAEVNRGVRGLRVGWSPDLGYALVEPEVRAICERAARRFADLGCTVEEATPGFPNPSADQTFFVLAATSDAVWLSELSEADLARTGEAARTFLEFGRRTSGTDYVRANARRMHIWQTMQSFHEQYDLLLTPALSVTAFPVGQPPTQAAGQDFAPFGWSPFTQPFNLTGQPAASVPCGFDGNGLPVGLQIVGRAFEDATVLRAARAFEEMQPWAERRPDVAAYATA